MLKNSLKSCVYEIKPVTLQQNCLSNTNIGYIASREEEVKIGTCGLLCTLPPQGYTT